MISRKALWLLALVLLFSLLASADERILDFHDDIQIQPNATLLVHETIRVRSEGQQIKHGIFRDFPTQYHDRLGNAYTVNFSLQSAKRDGVSEDYQVEDIKDGVRIRLGNAATLVPPGEHTYELTYTATREIGFFANDDELYWNVTGLGWQFPIDHASAAVTVPSPGGNLKYTGYTGPANTRGRDFEASAESNTSVSFVTTRALATGEGLTIVIGFPKGLVAPPSQAQRVFWFLEDNASTLVGLVGFALISFYYLLVWLKVAHSPKAGTIMVRYEPPKSLSPPAMRYLKHRSYDDRVFTSAIVDLAVQRQLSIKQDQKQAYTLTRVNGPAPQLPPEEANLLQNLFQVGESLMIDGTYTGAIGTATATLKSDLKKIETGYLHSNAVLMIPGVLLTLMTFGAMLLGIPDVQGSRGGAAIVAVFLVVFPFAFVSSFRQAWRGRKSGRAGSNLMGSFIFFVFWVAIIALFIYLTNVAMALIVVVLVLVNAAFFVERIALTQAGRALLDEVEGFKEFLVSVEGDRMQRLNPPNKTPELFEKYLPYALALGVEQRWAQQFAGVLAEAATVSGGATTAYSPAWYIGTTPGLFDSGSFASGLSGGFSSALSSSCSPPASSSGFGGGGSSGGGGGGGGGGGW